MAVSVHDNCKAVQSQFVYKGRHKDAHSEWPTAYSEISLKKVESQPSHSFTSSTCTSIEHEVLCTLDCSRHCHHRPRSGTVCFSRCKDTHLCRECTASEVASIILTSCRSNVLIQLQPALDVLTLRTSRASARTLRRSMPQLSIAFSLDVVPSKSTIHGPRSW